METGANPHNRVGGILAGAVDRPDAPIRYYWSSERHTDPQFRRAGNRGFLASQHFPGDLDLAEPRNRGDEHRKFRRAVDAPGHRKARVWNGAGQFLPRRDRRTYRDGGASRARQACGIHDRWTSRTPLCGQARASDPGAANRKTDICVPHWCSLGAHVQKILGSLSNSFSILADSHVYSSSNLCSPGRGQRGDSRQASRDAGGARESARRGGIVVRAQRAGAGPRAGRMERPKDCREAL